MPKRARLPRWCSEFIDHTGTPRVRFRRKGYATRYLHGVPWSAEFMAAYRSCLDGTAAPAIEPGKERTIPGTINALIAAYYRSTEFLGLKPSSQKIYRYALEAFRAEHGDKRVAALERVHIKAIVAAKAATPTAANNLLNKLKALMAFAVDIGMRKDDPTHGLRGMRIEGDGFHTWTETEIAQFEARHPVGTKARLALALALYTAQRRSDLIRMGWQHLTGDKIAVKQIKTGARLDLPVHPKLGEILAELPRNNLTFLINDWGKPFAPGSISNWFRLACMEAGLPHCSLHGLRKAAARRLAEAGCSAHEIAAVTGHATLKEVERYTRAADQRALAEQALARTSREQNVVPLANRASGLAKSGAKPLNRKGA